MAFERALESGLTAWIAQKAAKGAWFLATPLIALSDCLEEVAFRAGKKHERRGRD